MEDNNEIVDLIKWALFFNQMKNMYLAHGKL